MGTRVDPQNRSNRSGSGSGWVPEFSSWVPGRRSARYLLVLVVLVGMGFVTYDFYRYGVTAQRFRVELTVEGLQTVSEDRVRSVLEPVLGSGEDARSLLAVDVSGVYSRLTEEIPRFRDITVQKQYPRRLLIQVEERQPVALIKRYESAPEETVYLPVDRDGIPFEPTPEEVRTLPKRLPVIRGLEEDDPSSDSYRRRWKRSWRVLSAVRSRFSLDVLNWIEVIPGGFVRIQINRPKELVIRLGMNRYEYKLRRLHEMMQTQEFLEINEYVDLSDPGNIRVK